MNRLFIISYLWPVLMQGQISFIKNTVTHAYINQISRPLELSNGNFIGSAQLAANDVYTNNIYLFSKCGELITTLQVSTSEDHVFINNLVEMESGDILATGTAFDSTYHSIFLVLDNQTLEVKRSRRTFEMGLYWINNTLIENGRIYQGGISAYNVVSSSMNQDLQRNLHLYKVFEDIGTASIRDVRLLNFTKNRIYTAESYDDYETDAYYDVVRCMDAKLRVLYTIGGISDTHNSNFNYTVGFFGNDTLLVGVQEWDPNGQDDHKFIRKYYKDSLLYEKEVQQFNPILEQSTCYCDAGILKCAYYNGEIAWFNSFGEQIFYDDHLKPLMREGDMVGAIKTSDGGLFSFADSFAFIGDKWEYVLKVIKTTADYQINEFPDPECIVSTDHPQSDPGILLFPNPTKGMIHIVSNEIVTQLKIFNVNSALLLTAKPSAQEFDIYLDLVAGSYAIQIETGRGWIVRKVVVVD